jgi:hypothetical protein
VEPFAGSLAVLLARPHPPQIETVNDADGFICNFFRALQSDPETVARYADWPVNENDLHARHRWLVGQRQGLTARLEGNPEYCDARIAGWWVWGISCWIGGGWCSGQGPWTVNDAQELVRLDGTGQGVHRGRVQLGDGGMGVHRPGQRGELGTWFVALADRLRHVRVCCGDWSRVCGPTPTVKHGVTGLLLDPPYGTAANRDADVYATDSLTVADDVRQWALAHGDDPRLRIALCGYDGEHAMPHDWTRVGWKAQGGYGSQDDGRGRANAQRETVWFSPHCLRAGLFDGDDSDRQNSVIDLDAHLR